MRVKTSTLWWGTSEHIIQKGVNAELDELMRELKEAQTNQETMQSFFNMIMRNTANSCDDTDYVRINTTEKSGRLSKLLRLEPRF